MHRWIRAARRRAGHGIAARDRGFTLIELLVVVLIIGVLAAVAIPMYLSSQDSSKDAAVVSDLSNAKTAVVSYASTHDGAWPSAISGTILKNDGYPGPSVAYAANAGPDWQTVPALNATQFCIWAVSPSGTTFSVTHDRGVAKQGC